MVKIEYTFRSQLKRLVFEQLRCQNSLEIQKGWRHRIPLEKLNNLMYSDVKKGGEMTKLQDFDILLTFLTLATMIVEGCFVMTSFLVHFFLFWIDNGVQKDT